MLTHSEASRERLLSMVRQLPGAAVGVKIAALLLLQEGQRPGWIAEVLGVTRQSLNLWMQRVNAQGLKALEPMRPGRPTRLTPTVRQELEEHLKRSPTEFGLNRARWDGPTFAVHLRRRFGITLTVRQAQWWRQRLGYRVKRAGYSYLQPVAKRPSDFAEPQDTAVSTARGDDRLC